MIRGIFFAILLSALFLVSSSSSVFADDKSVLVEAKCNKCHAVSALGIEKKKSKKKKKAPDLSTTGKFHDAEFLNTYLKKETAHTPHEGLDSTKKHKTKVKATGEAFDNIVKALVNLKGE